MRHFTVTASTMGQSSPASVAEGRWYTYRGSRPLGDTPPEATAGGAARTARRERRIDAFAAALASLGETDPWHVTRPVVIKAGRMVGVQEKTAMGYRTALRQRQPQRQENCDGC